MLIAFRNDFSFYAGKIFPMENSFKLKKNLQQCNACFDKRWMVQNRNVKVEKFMVAYFVSI